MMAVQMHTHAERAKKGGASGRDCRNCMAGQRDGIEAVL
jgi:hypothetical protein